MPQVKSPIRRIHVTQVLEQGIRQRHFIQTLLRLFLLVTVKENVRTMIFSALKDLAKGSSSFVIVTVIGKVVSTFSISHDSLAVKSFMIT